VAQPCAESLARGCLCALLSMNAIRPYQLVDATSEENDHGKSPDPVHSGAEQHRAQSR
jgi:hypothetical protein